MSPLLDVVALGVAYLLDAVVVLVFVQWIFALVGADPAHPLVRGVDALAGPPLRWLARRLPFLRFGGWDFSPVALALICAYLKAAVLGRSVLPGLLP